MSSLALLALPKRALRCNLEDEEAQARPRLLLQLF